MSAVGNGVEGNSPACQPPNHPHHAPPSPRALLRAKLVRPLLTLLRKGATPQRLAWSLAVGFAIGINPLLGSTTIACFALAYIFRLNIVASQLANHIIYPLELLLLLPFIRAGELLFHTQQMPLSPALLLREARIDPVQTTAMLWTWEWHALVAWALTSAVLVPALALALIPLLRHAQKRISQRKAAPVR